MSLRKKEFIINMIVLAIIAIIMFLANEFSPNNSLRIALTIGSHCVLLVYLMILGNSNTTYFGLSKKILKEIYNKKYGEILKITDVKKNSFCYGNCEYDLKEDTFIERTFLMSSGKKLLLREKFYAEPKNGSKYDFVLMEV